MAVTARVQCGNRSFVLKVMWDGVFGYLAQVWDEEKQDYRLGDPEKTIEAAKREAERLLRVYLKTQGLDYPDFKLNWTEL
jgi:hypothetical protein